VGVRDIRKVSDGAWRSGDTVRGGDGRDAGRQYDADMVFGSCEHQSGALDQPCWHWIIDAYSTWGKHRACDIHGQGTRRAHGMRGNRVGIGDINDMQGLSICIWWLPAGCDDGGGATRERDTGMVGRFHCCECDATTESCCDRISVRDDTRGEHGACDVHGAGTGGALGMRGDRVGVGDICEVSCEDWRSGDTPSGVDGRGDRGKRDTGMVGRLGVVERDAPWEPSRDRIGVNNDTRGKPGAWDNKGTGWELWM